jgi:hypothetical protein
MGILDDPTDPHATENLRRSIVMLNSGQSASIDRDGAVRLLEELQRLRAEQGVIAVQLTQIVARLDASSRRTQGAIGRLCGNPPGASRRP